MPIASGGTHIYSPAQINADSIEASEIATDAVDSAEIKAQAVKTAEIEQGAILNEDINAAAGIVDTKLATISTAGKVDGAAITGLANVPAGAGNLPAANLGNAVGDLVVTKFAGEMALSTGTLTADPADASVVAYIAMADAAQSNAMAVFKVPKGATSISAIKYLHAASVNAGNVAISIKTSTINTDATAAPTIDSTNTFVAVTVPGTVGQVAKQTAPADAIDGLGAIDVDDFVYVNIRRNGSDGTDTAAGTWYLHAIEITFA